MFTIPSRVVMGTTLVLAVAVVLQIRLSAYTFITIDYPGAANTKILGINDAGHIVGTADSIGFVWRNSQFRPITVPGATGTVASAINDRGWIVGTFSGAGLIGTTGAFAFVNGQFTIFEFPGTESFSQTHALGVNNRGDIVGSYIHSPNEHPQGYVVRRNGGFTAISPAPHETWLFAINSVGQMAGWDRPIELGPRRGFVYAGDVFTSIDVPESLTQCEQGDACPRRTRVYGIDDALRIVGEYEGQTADLQGGFVLAGGAFTSINVPGAIKTAVTRSNTGGTLVGWYQDTAGATHGFIATP